jgi:hypothetical protein
MSLSLIVFGLLACIAGALASANFVIEKLPNSKAYIEKMIPYQAIVGVIAMILSIQLYCIHCNCGFSARIPYGTAIYGK